MNIVWYLSIVVKSEAVSNIKDGSFEKNSHTFYQYFIKSTNADTNTDIAFLTDANISELVKSIGLSMLTSSFSLLEFYVEGPKGEPWTLWDPWKFWNNVKSLMQKGVNSHLLCNRDWDWPIIRLGLTPFTKEVSLL